MAGSTIWAWSSTAGDNATADSGLTWSEGQAPSTVNNSARVMMKRVADLLKDLGGVAEAGGTANALTLTSANSFTAYEDGLMVSFRAAATNTDETTLNVNLTSAKPIVKMTSAGETVLGGGEIQKDGIYELVYSMDLNGAAGAWLLVNPSDDHVSAGIIVMWSGAADAIPTGWVLCDGTSNTPDLTDRFIVGAGDSYDIGDTGGSDSVTLTTAQLPAHSHSSGSLKAASAGEHTHTIPFRFTSPCDGGDYGRHPGTSGSTTTSSAGAHTHDITGSTSNAGSGGSHENRPPYFALAFIMKT